MRDDFLEFLQVTGELDKDNSLSNPTINDLYNTYNSMFPSNPLDNEFFSLTFDEQVVLLEESINSGSPIVRKIR